MSAGSVRRLTHVQGGYCDNVSNGRNGIDTLSYSGASRVTVDLNDNTPQDTDSDGLDTLSGFQNVNGSAYGDMLTGDSRPSRSGSTTPQQATIADGRATGTIRNDD